MTYEKFAEKYNIQLNEQQTEAAKTVEGPCLLLAVPGSGKTTVLVNRLGYMLYGCGIKPENILVLTYTVAATKDMSERFVKFFGEEYKDILEFRTINGICAKILLYYSRMIGRPSFDLESNEGSHVLRIAKAYQDATHQYPSESDVQEIAASITYIKNMMLDDKQILEMEKKCDYPLHDIFTRYNNSLRNDQKIDYDDQMVYAYRILKADEGVLEHFRNIYKYICVDEAQDTSKIQHMIISLLAGKKGNLFMVGDEDQSIYGFRAAYPQALLDFEKDHPGAKVLLMEENFRSNANIVEAADTFISKNTLRYKKTLKAFRPRASAIKVIKVNERAGQHKELLNVARQTDEEVAVLYRDNESVIPLVDILDKNHISFRIKNSELTFFSHKVVTDITSIFKFLINDRDAESFMRIYYRIGVYIKKEDAFKLVNAADGKSIIDTGLKLDILNKGAINQFLEIKRAIKLLKTKNVGYCISYIMDILGYENFLKKAHTSTKKIDILRMTSGSCGTMQEGLTRLKELEEMIRNNPNDENCNLILSTIHSSKGLEYDNVYMLDVIDGIFPDKVYNEYKKISAEEKAEYEETRRIFYVGITRAKNNLYLFRTGEPATFINEIHKVQKTPDKTNLTKSDTKISYEEFRQRLKKGRNVKHMKYGNGIVLSVEEPFVTIKFNKDSRECDMRMLYKSKSLKFIL